MQREGTSAAPATGDDAALISGGNARLAVLAPQDRDPKWLAQLEALRSHAAALAVPQRIRYQFTLGWRRENAGDFDGAFAAYAEGNRLQWERLDLARRYPAREALDARFAERIRETFSGIRLRSASPSRPADSRVPIFIVGMPQSGTSAGCWSSWVCPGTRVAWISTGRRGQRTR